jgi:hypothetical protein
MAANHDRYVDSFKDGDEAICRRKPGKYLEVVSRCRMAEEHLAHRANLDPECLRPAGQQLFVFGMKLLRVPTNEISELFRHFG